MQGKTKHDVLVIGGGPAGSVTAAALAREGLKVRLVERAHFPRYHIGESLTPSCRTVLGAIGIAEALDSHGFVLKYGGAIRWDDDAWFFDWGQMGVNSWQVDRAEFDQLLLGHAQASGADVTMGVTARSVSFAQGRPVAVTCVPEDGEPYVIDGFRYLIDATGRAGLLSVRHLGIRQPEPTLRNIAIWSYWRSAAVLPDTPQGGINIISSPAGWYWIIPLAGDRASIGFVTRKDWFTERRPAFESADAMYRALIDESSAVRALLAEAEYLGPVRVETDYSYAAERFCGPGYMLVGDAACFLDPLLSTGVHLALYSAINAAACIASVHRSEITEEAANNYFEYAFRRGYTRLFGKDGFFRLSDALAGAPAGQDNGTLDPPSSAAFTEIIAGLSDLREAEDANTRVLTGQLLSQALSVQRRAMAASTPGVPDFSSVLENPLRDAESAQYRLVTAPRLGLERTPDQPA